MVRIRMALPKAVVRKGDSSLVRRTKVHEGRRPRIEPTVEEGIDEVLDELADEHQDELARIHEDLGNDDWYDYLGGEGWHEET
jgi:hypothetical protein